MLKHLAYLLAGNGTASIVLFLRNIIIARLVSVEDFGIAATFALTFALIETMTNVALDRLMVQAKDGDDERFQATLHSLQIIRCTVGALVLFALAYPYAAFLKAPEAVSAYQILAVVPFLKGLNHFDMYREQRGMKFSGLSIIVSASPIVGTLAIGGLALVLNDYWIMLWSIIIQQAVYTALTHMFAKRPYRIAWDRLVVRRGLSFGFPLLLSNIVMFLTLQGDRLIIGNQLGPEVLGWYSAAFLLIATPMTIVLSTYQTMTLPILSKYQDDEKLFGENANLVVEGALFLSVFIALGVFLCGSFVFLLAFGEKYAAGLVVLSLLSLSQGLRIWRGGFYIVFLSNADTRAIFWCNSLRLAALPVAYTVLILGWDIQALLLCNIAGETLALLFAARVVIKQNILRAKNLMVAGLSASIFFGAIAFFSSSTIVTSELVQVPVVVVLFFATLLSLKDGRRWLFEKLRQRVNDRTRNVSEKDDDPSSLN